MEKRKLRVLNKRTIEVMVWLADGGYKQSFLHYDESVQDTCCIRVRSHSKWGALDTNGTMVLDIAYDELEPLGDKYLGRQGFQRCFYDVNGNLLFADILGNYTVEHLLEGKVAVVRQICKDWRFAFFDIRKSQLLSDWGHWCVEINSGFLLEDNDSDAHHNRCLFADKEGKLQIVEYFQKDGYQMLTANGGCSVFEKKNKILQLPCDMIQPSDFGVPGKMWFVPTKDGKKALYDAKGQKILDFAYDEILRIGWYGGQELFLVKVGANVGVVARNDETLLPLQYKKILPLEEGFLLVSDNAKEGYAQSDGRVVLPPVYQRLVIDSLSQMIKAFENDRCTIHDMNGKKLLPDAYAESEIYLCKEGIIVKDGTFIARTGDVVLSGFTKIERLSLPGYEALLVCRDREFGVFSFKGEEIVPVEYELIEANNFGYRGIDLF